MTFTTDSKPLTGYADADWGNCHIDRRSYTGYCFILCGGSISWCSRKQKTVALSSTEAEYMSLTEAGKEAVFLIGFLKELGHEDLTNVTLFNDNQSAGKLVKNTVFHAKSKHIETRYHFIRQAVMNYPLVL